MRTQLISCKLKLEYSVEQGQALRALSVAYRDALNFASKTTFDTLGKTSNNRKIHDTCYKEYRETYGLGAQLACTVSRQVASTYKTLWTRAKQHKANRQKGWTKKRYKGLDKAPKFSAGTVEMQYNRDFSWSKGNKVSIKTLGSRIKLDFKGYSKHLDLISKGAEVGAAKLWWDRTSKQWYLIVSIEIEKQDVDLNSITKVKGVDVGQRCLAVSTDSEGKTKFIHGGVVKSKCRQYTAVRESLQIKGTRGAKRALVRLSMRERRFKSDVNHKLAVSILDSNALIGMEDLKNIRENTMGKRKKSRNGATEKQCAANRDHNSWAYAALYNFVAYKSFFCDSIIVQVDARNTSKGCAKCGHVDDGNRPQGAVIFRCTKCGHTVHSDKNGADNILLRTVVRRQDLLATGCLSTTPGTP